MIVFSSGCIVDKIALDYYNTITEV